MSVDYPARVNQYLAKLIQGEDQLSVAMTYSALAGGKRFRPILTYTVAKCFGAELSRADSSACALELIHIYSLIHDDLPAMDDDDLRHNQPTCHKKFGEAQAILAGDALQALAFSTIADDSHLEDQTKVALLQQLGQAAFEMAQGQSIDLSVVSKQVDIQPLEHMHSKKTGALLSCAVRLGAIVANCSEQDQQLLQKFSQAIGLAYQIQDDVLDIESSSEVLGKAQNSDVEKNKPTYPAILGLEESKGRFEALYQQAMDVLALINVDTTELEQLTQQLRTRRF